jgi:putative transposase
MSDKSVGVDMGITNAIALSNGGLIEGPRFLRKAEERIKELQKALSKKKNGSKRREKAKILLAKAWRKVRRQRNDLAHKVSNKLAREYRTIVFENLNIRRMVKKHSLASAIMDSCWYRLRQFTTYKADE